MLYLNAKSYEKLCVLVNETLLKFTQDETLLKNNRGEIVPIVFDKHFAATPFEIMIPKNLQNCGPVWNYDKENTDRKSVV